MTERHLDLLQKHRELQKAFDDTLEMNRKLGSENWKFEKENEQLKSELETYQILAHKRGECYLSSLRKENKLKEENEQLKQGLKLYKKALELFVNWADECDFGYDNLGDLYSEYKDEIESLKYQEGLIHIAVSEAKKELADERC